MPPPTTARSKRSRSRAASASSRGITLWEVTRGAVRCAVIRPAAWREDTRDLAPAPRRSKMPNQNVELLRGAYDAFDRGDIPAILAILDDDVVWNTPEVLPHGMSAQG